VPGLQRQRTPPGVGPPRRPGSIRRRARISWRVGQRSGLAVVGVDAISRSSVDGFCREISRPPTSPPRVRARLLPAGLHPRSTDPRRARHERSRDSRLHAAGITPNAARGLRDSEDFAGAYGKATPFFPNRGGGGRRQCPGTFGKARPSCSSSRCRPDHHERDPDTAARQQAACRSGAERIAGSRAVHREGQGYGTCRRQQIRHRQASAPRQSRWKCLGSVQRRWLGCRSPRLRRPARGMRRSSTRPSRLRDPSGCMIARFDGIVGPRRPRALGTTIVRQQPPHGGTRNRRRPLAAAPPAVTNIATRARLQCCMARISSRRRALPQKCSGRRTGKDHRMRNTGRRRACCCTDRSWPRSPIDNRRLRRRGPGGPQRSSLSWV